jgi:2-polyprenyl-3-methyl-5-hydroxy-6-metoxy-1,4-benzoquinol methylase
MTRDHARSTLTVANVSALARTIYADTQSGIGRRQKLRPRICPFHILIDHVPAGVTILDVGCGAGLFILLLARLGRIRSAVGFDADRAAILTAQKIAAQLPNSELIQFEHRDANDAWPAGCFDVVCLIDVLHHVKPEYQAELFKTAIDHVADGGMLLYKDMASRPLWRAWANRLHDFLVVHERIYYAELDEVVTWARKGGLCLAETGEIDMLWYRHEWCVFRRPHG